MLCELINAPRFVSDPEFGRIFGERHSHEFVRDILQQLFTRQTYVYIDGENTRKLKKQLRNKNPKFTHSLYFWISETLRYDRIND